MVGRDDNLPQRFCVRSHGYAMAVLYPVGNWNVEEESSNAAEVYTDRRLPGRRCDVGHQCVNIRIILVARSVALTRMNSWLQASTPVELVW